jgi:hypothetical protein
MLGWLTKWRESVDFGLRPRHVHEGGEVNLYPSLSERPNGSDKISIASKGLHGRNEIGVCSYRTMRTRGPCGQLNAGWGVYGRGGRPVAEGIKAKYLAQAEA